MDLLECYLSKMAVIGGVNLVKIAVGQGLNDLLVFHNIGTCDQKPIRTSIELDSLLDHYLVWYKPNSQGMQGWQIPGSYNYKAREYLECILRNTVALPQSIHHLINSLSEQVTAEIMILAAQDINTGRSIIVDGTKRAMALLLMNIDSPKKTEPTFKSIYPISLLTLRSKQITKMFPCDYLKL